MTAYDDQNVFAKILRGEIPCFEVFRDDRTFAFLKDTTRSRSPLIGYAYECQKRDAIDPQAWDIPLAGVATEQQFYPFSRA